MQESCNLDRNAEIEHFLTNSIGEILQSCLKTHRLITEANFCAFCDQWFDFKLLINNIILKCVSYKLYYVK